MSDVGTDSGEEFEQFSRSLLRSISQSGGLGGGSGDTSKKKGAKAKGGGKGSGDKKKSKAPDAHTGLTSEDDEDEGTKARPQKTQRASPSKGAKRTLSSGKREALAMYSDDEDEFSLEASPNNDKGFFKNLKSGERTANHSRSRFPLGGALSPRHPFGNCRVVHHAAISNLTPAHACRHR